MILGLTALLPSCYNIVREYHINLCHNVVKNTEENRAMLKRIIKADILGEVMVGVEAQTVRAGGEKLMFGKFVKSEYNNWPEDKAKEATRTDGTMESDGEYCAIDQVVPRY